MTKHRKRILICGIILVTALLFITTILPVIIRNKAISLLSETTGRAVHLEKVRLNPFTLTMTLQGFSIDEAEKGVPFISFRELETSLGLASIWKRALIVSKLKLDSPVIKATRLAANRYSFNDIIDRIGKRPKSGQKSDVRFSVNNIAITNGSIDFFDNAVTGKQHHTIRGLRLALPFISNIPYLVDTYTDPILSATIDQAPFTFKGKVKPLSKSLDTSVTIALQKLHLPQFMAYSPVKPPVDLVSGSLTTDLELHYKISANMNPELTLSGKTTLEDIAVNLKDGKPLVRFSTLAIDARKAEIIGRKFDLAGISLDGFELFASRTGDGNWMYQQLLPTPHPVSEDISQQKTPKDTGNAVAFQLDRFIFSKGLLHVVDKLPHGGFQSDISDITILVNNLSNNSAKPADFNLSLAIDKDATVSVKGGGTITPASLTASASLTGLKLEKGWPYLSPFLTAPVKGVLDLSGDVAYNSEHGVRIQDGKLQLKNLSTRYGNKEGFELSRLEMRGATYSEQENRAEIAEITMSGGKLSATREKDGTLSPLSLLVKPTASPINTPAKVAQVPQKNAVTQKKPLTYRIGAIRVDRFNTRFLDRGIEEPAEFELSGTKLAITGINGPKLTPMAVSFATTLNRDTLLKASGELTPASLRYKGNLSVNRLAIRDFENYFPDSLNLYVVDGTIDTAMRVDIAMKDGKPSGSFAGTAGVRSLHCIDSVAEDDLLKWESLQLDGITGNLEPPSLSIQQIALNNVYSRIIVRKDGTLNLQNLVERSDKGKDAVPAVHQEQTALAAKQRPVVTIGTVTIQEGTLAFSDHHLPRDFNSTFHHLGGRVSGLSSEEAKLADVDLRGNLENHSPLQITGTINPLKQDLFVDLKVAFKDIELSPITPYSGTYLGYTVDKGKLSLDLKYLIDKKKLTSENRIFVDQFTFGDKVESDKATKLPVRLGLALLKDRKGEIHLDVPITGQTDDPKFSVWKLVFQVLQNLMVKAVTSPFSLLSSMFGGGEDFSSIQFPSGASSLPPGEEKKLTALSKALLDRPALKVELKGYVDREKDTEGYRIELLLRRMKAEKYLALGKERVLKDGEKAENMVIQPEEYDKYLAAVYKKEKFPKPRNAFGLVKDIPAGEMKKLILANIMIGDQELQTLAHERVTAIMNYLVTTGNVPVERVFQKNDTIYKQPDKEQVSRSRVELNAIAQ